MKLDTQKIQALTESWITGTLKFPIAQHHIPHGIYLARDIKRLLPDLPMQRIFDVGANQGQTAIQCAIAFPKARIDSFEPISSTYAELIRNVARRKNVHCHNLALGSEVGEANMITDRQSEHSRIDASGTTSVKTSTVDQFCNDHAIKRINLLKIDTEGHDLEVLHGAQKMLGDQSADLLEVEVGMNHDNNLHVHFQEFMNYLIPLEYQLFGIYEQQHEWKTGAPNLRRANFAFVSRRAINSSVDGVGSLPVDAPRL